MNKKPLTDPYKMDKLSKAPFTPKAIGIFGGSFDPFHLGHLRLITAVHHHLQLQEIRLIPCVQSLLRDAPLASTTQRLEMLNLLTKNYAWLKVDDR